MVDILIDTLKLTDKDEYLKLMKEFRPLDTEISNDKFKDIYESILTSGKVYIARIDNKIVGAITLLIEQKVINNFSIYTRIEDLVVADKYRGRGIGGKLVKYAIEKAKCLKARKILLVSDDKHLAFYKKYGFICENNNMSCILK